MVAEPIEKKYYLVHPSRLRARGVVLGVLQWVLVVVVVRKYLKI
jgi:hypothetical protein